MEKTEKYRRFFEKFEKAFRKFKELIESPHLFDFLNEELVVEITTKRFEYTFESLWKTLQAYFRRQGVDCSTPLKCFKEAFKAGFIKEEDESLIGEMIEKRNQIVHVYDADEAVRIYEFIKNEALFLMIESLYVELKEKLESL